jgi:hypothetical protein
VVAALSARGTSIMLVPVPGETPAHAR